MGFLRGNRNQVKPDYTGLQIQTSVSTLPIPIVWGQGKVGGNVIWYTDFIATPLHASGGGGGKGGGSQISGYNYNVNVAMALCEGPVNLLTVYKDQSLYLYQWLGLTFYNGSTPQGVWAGFEAVSTSQLLAYQGTAFVAALYYNLGDSGSLGNHNFEVQGILAGTGVNGIDADPAQVINDFLTNGQYGVAGLNGATFPSAMINGATLFGSGGDSSLQTYCKALGICFSPVLTSQEQASSILTRWLQICNCAAVWSGGMLSFVPYGDSSIGSGSSSTITAQFTIPTPIPPNSTSEPQIPAQVPVSSPAQFASDGGVKYASTGAALTFLPGVTIPTAAGTYGCVNGTYYFAPPDEGLAVIVTYTVQTVTSFVPNLTPAYAIGDNNFVDERGNKDPLQVERVDIFSLPTIQRIEVSSRSNRYSPVPVEARDQAMIEQFGPRVGPVIQAHEICDEFTIGPLVAQTLLQRELYVRAKFTFKLSWEFCLLDPMDIVTLTDANLGLSNYPVRIISIDEDDKGLLTVVAEELVTGVSSPAYNPSAGAGSALPSFGAPAWGVNTPLVFEPPTTITGGVPQLWLGASGQYGQTMQWGGAYVWLSVDGVNFSQIATLDAPLRQGFLTAPLPSASGWDSTDTLAVSLTESGGTLTGTSQAAAQAGGTLSLIDGELVAYQNAALTGANAYSLTGLQRGMGGTNAAAHGTGAPFARLDSAVFQYTLPQNLIGRTLYVKFQSFNAFGGGVQSLANCTAYTFAATGTSDPIAAQLLSGAPLDLGAVNASPTLSDDFGVLGGGVASIIDLGVITLSDPIATQLLSGSAVDLGPVTGAATVFDDFGQITIVVTQTVNLGTAP
ncbi:putative tail protein [Roseiarcus fermentans]|uniref:Putative tail protein n=1 Tax=Roseiarcus fermentans TaxID=1473586 RepID=A0A366EQN5_9HYPH|nr:phage tail protein [Roseiarcus fermentans]RBP03795.1 putative tail protein [Roseiarcus fermentans]